MGHAIPPKPSPSTPSKDPTSTLIFAPLRIEYGAIMAFNCIRRRKDEKSATERI